MSVSNRLAIVRKQAQCLLAVLSAAALAVGCNLFDQSGVVAASSIGDVSNPATRGEPDLELRQACGQGGLGPEGASTLRRAPYLQQVTHSSAAVLWTSMSPEPATVVVSRPDGEAVAALPAKLDRGAFTADGARQWMVRLEGLEPSTIYCYELRQGDRTLVEPTGFRTAPHPDSDEPARFLVFGDSGEAGDDQIAVLEQMRSVPYDFMVHTGDIAYNSGTMLEFENNYFAAYAPLLQNFPLFPVSGNHDYRTDDAAPFRSVYCLPENGGRNGRERWYSFDWGPVHFAMLDTEWMSDEQAAWLDEDLAKTDRPWLIAVGHKPPYSSGFHGNDKAFQAYFGPILEKHRVALVLNGHDHDYERTKPLNGITYVVTGGGGRGVKSVGVSEFTAFSESVLHFVYVTADRTTLRLHAIDATGQEFDSVTLTR